MGKKITKKTTKKVVRKGLDLDKVLAEVDDSSVVIMKANSESNAPYRVNFRNLALQKITNGVAGGRMIEISGDSQSGKSFLLYELMRSVIEAGGAAFLVDTENAFEPAFARRIGLDKSGSFGYTRENDIEKVFLLLRRFIKAVRKQNKTCPIMVGIDSFAGLVHPDHKENIENEKGQKGFAAMQKNALFNFHLSEFCPDYLGTRMATMCFVNHTRKDHTVLFGDGTYTLGEKGIQYWCDTRLRGKVQKALKEEVKTGNKTKKKKQVGVVARWTATKTRGVESHQSVDLKINFSKGMSKFTGFTELLLNDGLIELDSEKYKTKNENDRTVTRSRKIIKDLETGEVYRKVSDFIEARPEVLTPKFIDDVSEDIEVDYDDLEDFE